MNTSRRTVVSIVLVTWLTIMARVFALSGDLQGLSQGNATNGWNANSAWSGGNLQDWNELDYVPCRVTLSGSPRTNESVTITFPHFHSGIPGFQNLYFLSNSVNLVFDEEPVLNAPAASSDWSYSMRVTITNTQTAYIYFHARLAAGAHMNVGSSLQLSGQPSLSPLQIHKPGPGPGSPDLAITKSAPSVAGPGDIITYTLTFTNKATGTNTGVGVQITDTLPLLVSYVPGSAS